MSDNVNCHILLRLNHLIALHTAIIAHLMVTCHQALFKMNVIFKLPIILNEVEFTKNENYSKISNQISKPVSNRCSCGAQKQMSAK